MLKLKLKSRWKEIWNQVETNPIQRFPKFDGLSQPPSSFEDVFRHFVMNLSDFFWLHSHFSVHGRAHHSFPTSLVPNKSLYLASTFSASPHRGLRHSSQNQKQIQITIWWWDEVPCLPGRWEGWGCWQLETRGTLSVKHIEANSPNLDKVIFLENWWSFSTTENLPPSSFKNNEKFESIEACLDLIHPNRMLGIY